MHGAFTAGCVQGLGWGKAVRARLSPLGVTLPHGAHFDPKVGCAALAAAAETALMTPKPDSSLDSVYYSIKMAFQMEPVPGGIAPGAFAHDPSTIQGGSTLAANPLGSLWTTQGAI